MMGLRGPLTPNRPCRRGDAKYSEFVEWVKYLQPRVAATTSTVPLNGSHTHTRTHTHTRLNATRTRPLSPSPPLSRIHSLFLSLWATTPSCFCHLLLSLYAHTLTHAQLCRRVPRVQVDL